MVLCVGAADVIPGLPNQLGPGAAAKLKESAGAVVGFAPSVALKRGLRLFTVKLESPAPPLGQDVMQVVLGGLAI